MTMDQQHSTLPTAGADVEDMAIKLDPGGLADNDGVGTIVGLFLLSTLSVEGAVLASMLAIGLRPIVADELISALLFCSLALENFPDFPITALSNKICGLREAPVYYKAIRG